MRLIHLADLHLGYKTYNRVDKEGFNLREKDILRAFKEALDKIVQLNPDLVLMAGDIFHRPRPSNSTILMTLRLLLSFRKSCKAPIVMIAGNHDAVKSIETGSVLKIFENVIPDTFVVDKKTQGIQLEAINTNIMCVPHGGLATLEDSIIEPDKAFNYNVLMIHGTYESCPEIAGYGNGSPIKTSDINENLWDYIAFGHYHKFTELAPNAYYSGAIERTTTNIWQESNDKKGFIEFDLENKVCKHHSLSTPRKVVDVKRIDAGCMTGADITAKIVEEISKIPDLDKSIVRVTFENIDPIAMKEVDYKKINEIRRMAVYFRVNFIKKDFSRNLDSENQTASIRKGILEYLEDELKEFELSQGLDKDKFSIMAKEYLTSELTV